MTSNTTANGGKGDPPDPPYTTTPATTTVQPTDTPAAHRAKNDSSLTENAQVSTENSNDNDSSDIDDDMDFLDTNKDFFQPVDEIEPCTDNTPPVTTVPTTDDRLFYPTDSEWNSSPWSIVLYNNTNHNLRSPQPSKVTMTTMPKTPTRLPTPIHL